MQRHLRAPAEAQPSLFGKGYFAKLRTGKHTAGFGSQDRERKDKQVPSRFQLTPCTGAGIHPGPAPTHPCQAPGHLTCHPGRGKHWWPRNSPTLIPDRDSLPMQELGVIHPRGRKAPAHVGEFRGTQKAAGMYLYFQYDYPTSPRVSDWMRF